MLSCRVSLCPFSTVSATARYEHLLLQKFTNQTHSRTFFVHTSHVTAACLSGAGWGEEGLVAMEPHSGLQAESPHDQQRRQLLLWRHDVTHHHPQCQLVRHPSQVLLLYRGCKQRGPNGEACTQRLHQATKQPAGVHAWWHRDQWPPAGGDQGERVWHICLFAQSHQKTPWCQRMWSASCPDQQSRRGWRLLNSRRDRNCFVTVFVFLFFSQIGTVKHWVCPVWR